MFPWGINVLSLFFGIGSAEVALYRLDIPLKADVQELNDDQLEQLMSRFGGFDLVVGGILCNNLIGRNKHHRDELKDFFQQSSEGHNEHNPNKENDRHGRGNNDVSRLEPVSQYNQSACDGLVHSYNTMGFIDL
ncbi:hypothetical protein F3Y22_tig00113725pilonHSYRG01929 [Hibiscus syriacus]|uniref:Uncharacterized protein n=1 Tax=Hibiscus syriacus TaxID=106335 RepID=A0A6A2X3V8_HIBSY|nr:hypothetical protein F3Y22_tig00113725pilonHSYRG01929 [Hibiscus syriacus]